jgi:hypothetical protein
MQKERASIPKVGLLGCFSLVKEKRRSEISRRDLQKPFGEFKTINSLQDEQMLSHHIEISIRDILTYCLPIFSLSKIVHVSKCTSNYFSNLLYTPLK